MNITGIAKNKTGIAKITHATYWKNAVKLKKAANFGEKGILLIIISALTVAVIVLYVVHSRQVDEQNQVNQELAQTESMLNGVQIEQMSLRKADLEQQLGQITAQFEAADAILSQPIQSFAVITALMDIAKENAVEINEVTLADKTSAELGEIPCSVMSLEVGVEGDVENLISFVTTLNSSFTTGLVESINITEIDGENTSAEMVLTIYSSEG